MKKLLFCEKETLCDMFPMYNIKSHVMIYLNYKTTRARHVRLSLQTTLFVHYQKTLKKTEKEGVHAFVNELVRLKIIPDRDIPRDILI